MLDEAFKAAIAVICVPLKDESPLPEPPMSSEESGLICPDCGNLNGSKVEVENAVVARCPDCQYEWPVQEHTQTYMVIDLLLEQRRRARAALAELCI